jgi:hypothetical protein
MLAVLTEVADTEGAPAAEVIHQTELASLGDPAAVDTLDASRG